MDVRILIVGTADVPPEPAAVVTLLEALPNGLNVTSINVEATASLQAPPPPMPDPVPAPPGPDPPVGIGEPT
jgi:hypothetical protein